MGSITGAIRDDIEEYVDVCRRMNIRPERDYRGFINPYCKKAKETLAEFEGKKIAREVLDEAMDSDSKVEAVETGASRVNWDSYFMSIAHAVSTRATCDRKHVGAVIVRDKHILATGYNGSIPGAAHCDDAGHVMEDGHCVRTVHAEVNALTQAARHGISVEGGTLYCNTFPCWNCFKQVATAGIKAVVFDHEYRMDPKVTEHASELGIALRMVER